MPTFPPQSLAPGESAYFFNAETPAEPSASDRFALQQAPYTSHESSISVEVRFSGDPGAFELNIQDSDTDADGYYQNVASGGAITSVDATLFTTRVELVPVKALFVRLAVVTIANAVSLTAKITR